MPTLVQICVVIVTLAFVAIVVATILALIRLGGAATRLSSAAQVSIDQMERTARETQELLISVREIVHSTRSVMARFQRLGERAADVSAAVLGEIEEPVLTAVAAARGVRTGTGRLLELLGQRFTQTRSSKNGEQDHE